VPFEAGTHAGSPVEPAGFEWRARGHVGLLSSPPDSTSQSKNGARTPRGSRLPTRPFSLSLFALSLFALSVSQLQLNPLMLKSYFFDSENIS
jgi:hypothetical protein